MADVADEQVDLAREASTHTSAIAQAGHQMARASKSSQLVAMNALISSARLGDSGGALAVLANEMQDLAGRVRRTAAEVAGLASDLSGLLPQIESNVSAVKHLTTRFLQDVEGSSTTVHEGVSGLRGALAGLDKNAEAAATEVARRAVLGHAALSWGPEVEGYLHELDDVADSLSQAARPGRAAA
jgi:methyl-accepting chemotaxis protein